MLNKIKEWSGVIALIAIILFLLLGNRGGSLKAGGVTNYDEVDATALKIGGSNGSRVGPIISGTGILIASTYNVIASSTFAGDVAVTGVVPGDQVWAQFATSTANGGGWSIISANASSTAGFITVRWGNFTGQNAAIPASVASSTNYLILHPVSTVPGL